MPKIGWLSDLHRKMNLDIRSKVSKNDWILFILFHFCWIMLKPKKKPPPSLDKMSKLKQKCSSKSLNAVTPTPFLKSKNMNRKNAPKHFNWGMNPPLHPVGKNQTETDFLHTGWLPLSMFFMDWSALTAQSLWREVRRASILEAAGRPFHWFANLCRKTQSLVVCKPVWCTGRCSGPVLFELQKDLATGSQTCAWRSSGPVLFELQEDSATGSWTSVKISKEAALLDLQQGSAIGS